MGEVQCHSCGSLVVGNAKFCRHCGVSFLLQCEKCGAENPVASRFCGECGTSLGSGPVRQQTQDRPSDVDLLAERRQLTVVFCDLVGSTALSARIDPEDFREILDHYRRAVAAVAQQYQGFVARHLGDGTLIYFGYPSAREFDTERAIRASLTLIQTIGALKVKEPITARIGIATGLVVVGDLSHEQGSERHEVLGETPNLAARLQTLAQPGQVIVSDRTKRLTGAIFEYRGLGTCEIKGFDNPVRAWEVVSPALIGHPFQTSDTADIRREGGVGALRWRESPLEKRTNAFRPASVVPLVDRSEELELLKRRWEQVANGEGHVVLLSGEPGIGKSRLAAELYEHIRADPHLHMRYFCSPHRQDSTLFPVLGLLERSAGFVRGDTSETKLDKLATTLTLAGPRDGDISLIVELMSLSGGERFPSLDLSPRSKRERTLSALLRQLEGLARRQPLLLTFEDLQWIDPTTRELLDLLVDRVDQFRVLLVATCRPEFRSAWTGLPSVTAVALNRLRHGDGATLVRRIGGGSGLSQELVEEIVRRADGVPLFTEELTKAVVESGDDPGLQSGSLLSPPSTVVPETLQGSLLARIDRLGTAAKRVAQIGAAVGRNFSFELLAAVARMPEADMQEGLRRLVNADLLLQRGMPPHASYLFKHALVQDVAYETLLRQTRRELHGRIADAIEKHFPERVGSEPELLAQHFANAGLPERAANYLLRAGQLALLRSAVVEAVAHLNRGLALLAEVSPSRERSQHQLELLLALAVAQAAVKGYASPDVTELYGKARRLCDELGDQRRLFMTLIGQFGADFIMNDSGKALRTAKEVLSLGIKSRDSRSERTGRRLVGMSFYRQGKLGEADTHLHRSLSDSSLPFAGSASTRSVQDGDVTGAIFLALTSLQRGLLEKGNEQRRTALARAREVSNPYTLAFLLSLVVITHWLHREATSLSDRAEELIRLCEEQHFSWILSPGIIHRGWVLVQAGQFSSGLKVLEGGVDSYRKMGTAFAMPYNFGLLASAHGKAGQFQRGLAFVSEGLEQASRTSENWFDAELHRIRGDLQLALNAPALAESAYQQARQIAESQQARLFELRASTSLARMWCKQQRLTEVGQLLSPVCQWFADEPDAPDVREAKALLSSAQC